jgi:hypothetical protein
MTIFNCHDETTAYHNDEVTLGKTAQDEMRARRDAGRTRLTTGLTRDGHPLPEERESQGSYAMRTMHQDEQCDYDIDDGAYFAKDDLQDTAGIALSPRAARERACKALQQDDRLKYPADIKENCVRQRYPDGYHIDIPIYRILRGKDWRGEEIVTYEHSSGDAWVESDARAVTRWFNALVGELNTGQFDGSQMRRVTKLTKKAARSRISWKSQTTSGICMTKLVVDHFVACLGRDDEALHKTWKAIHQSLSVSQRIAHPVLAGKNLAEYGDSEVVFFRDRLGEALKTLEVLDKASCTRAQARKAWDQVFNTTCFSDQPTDEDPENGDKKRGPFIMTSAEVARRDDGDRRFG